MRVVTLSFRGEFDCFCSTGADPLRGYWCVLNAAADPLLLRFWRSNLFARHYVEI